MSFEDKEIKFDTPNLQDRLRGGETTLDIISNVEDTKGNIGDVGRLMITNLRIIWYSVTTTKFNLSVGWSCVLTMTTKTVASRGRGTTQALYILSISRNSRFEFIFTNLTNSQSKFSSVFDIYRLYQSSTLYREMKLRSSILHEGSLNVLQMEKVFNTLNGVWNLSSDQGNLGTFIITNIRLVWFANINETFNMSLPYIQIANIQIRDSKYGLALVINTLKMSGGYVLGFRIDPPEKLHEIYKELTSLHTVYSETPIFGVDYKPKPDLEPQNNDHLSIDDIEEIDEKKSNEINHNFSAYLSAEDSGEVRRPSYCKELGFAMEKLKEGFKIKDLWEIIPYQ
ncbi:Bardet-Biedl syndrome 5 protein homolog [Phlebotomus papatasi]|uniref:Bardet-Biedl syndrome 5 protein homolog n=1 Tax=Phlebotomus papatasi TaxID=29031 RepID=UPI0024833855|nr:Bardet-Biedl syndrome 5 protein homolog [Phlebotomus papatasi]